MSDHTSIPIDWKKYPKLATMFEHRPAVNVYAEELQALLREVSANAVRFVKDANGEELAKARGEGWDAAIDAVLEGVKTSIATFRFEGHAAALERFVEVYVLPLVSAQAKAKKQAKASSSET